MNSAALRKTEPIINMQVVEAPVGVPQTKEATKLLMTCMLVVLGVTVLAVYSTWLKFRVEEKYSKLEKIIVQNEELDYEIAHLEAEVESLKDYHRIEQVLVENNIEIKSPNRAVYIALAGGGGDPVAKAGRSSRGARPKGNI